MKCIILAGGSGKRLWPVSRELYPKSFFNLDGGKTLIQNVFETASSLTAEKNILTVTNIWQYEDTYMQLKSLTAKPLIISEPMSKNTAPAILSALTYLKGKRDETVLILPVDFSIENLSLFKEAVEKAKLLVKQNYIAAFGIKPSYSESGFGYILAGDNLKTGRKIIKFIEKPAPEKAEEYIKQKDFYWNSGIYMAKISVLTEAFKNYAPKEYSNFSKEMFDDNNNIKYKYYENIPEISIDYAIMEKSDNMACVIPETQWTDYGSWKSIYNGSKKDSKKNVIKGNVISDNVKESFIYSSKELVAVSALKDTIVVETEDAVLVCDKSRAGDINKLVTKLTENNENAAWVHKTVFKPWGFSTCLNKGKDWRSKVVTVSAGQKISTHFHNYRSEHWVILEGSAVITLNNSKHTLEKHQSIDIPAKTKHSLHNNTKKALKILEVQKGEYIGEDDIIR